MKMFALISTAALSMSSMAFADGVLQLRGSTTIAGVLTDVITQSGLSDKISYQGGGSGAGEAALVAKQQGLAPMSRGFKADQVLKAQAQGFQIVDHVIALDGVSLFVNGANKATKLSFADLRAIFSCQKTSWSQFASSTLTGTIAVYVRDDASGTTDTIKSLAGIDKFGTCVKVVAESDDIANAANTDVNAIGYAGLSAKRDNNHALAISTEVNGNAVVPTVATIRNFSYPLSRALHVYSADGGFKPSAVEQQLLDKLTDRSFTDPIVQDHDFITLD